MESVQLVYCINDAMRNGIYTSFEGIELEIRTVRDDDFNVTIRYEGETCPFKDFIKSKVKENLFVLLLPIVDLENAYFVKTYCSYKGYIFQIFHSNDGSSCGNQRYKGIPTIASGRSQPRLVYD